MPMGKGKGNFGPGPAGSRPSDGVADPHFGNCCKLRRHAATTGACQSKDTALCWDLSQHEMPVL